MQPETTSKMDLAASMTFFLKKPICLMEKGEMIIQSYKMLIIAKLSQPMYKAQIKCVRNGIF